MMKVKIQPINTDPSFPSGHLDEKSFKLIVMGSAGVGKSSLIHRFIANQFVPQTDPMQKSTCYQKVFNYHKERIKFEIWDITEEDISNLYYNDPAAILVIYSVASLVSFLAAKRLVTEIKEKSSKQPVIALVGNKSDVNSSSKQVPPEEGFQFAMENCLFFLETSAASGDRVKELFAEIAWMLLIEPVNSLKQTPDEPFHRPLTPTSASSAHRSPTSRNNHQHYTPRATRSISRTILNGLSRASQGFIDGLSFMSEILSHDAAVFRDEMSSEGEATPSVTPISMFALSPSDIIRNPIYDVTNDIVSSESPVEVLESERDHKEEQLKKLQFVMSLDEGEEPNNPAKDSNNPAEGTERDVEVLDTIPLGSLSVSMSPKRITGAEVDRLENFEFVRSIDQEDDLFDEFLTDN